MFLFVITMKFFQTFFFKNFFFFIFVFLSQQNVTHPPVVVQLDISDLKSLPEKIAYIEGTFGHIDVLINNAGISVRADVVSMAVDLDVQVMLVNYFGAVALTKAVLPKMIERKQGRIVCVSSIQGKFSLPHRSAYSASKHALQAFCDSLRAEVAEHNIQVLCVSPGYINTALSLNALTASGRAYGSKYTEKHIHYLILIFFC